LEYILANTSPCDQSGRMCLISLCENSHLEEDFIRFENADGEVWLKRYSDLTSAEVAECMTRLEDKARKS
jgi:hypothetical protein